MSCPALTKPRQAGIALLGAAVLTGLQVQAAIACDALMAIGGRTPTVTKTIQLNGPLTFPFGRTNFNTDFIVTDVFRSYWVHLTNESDKEGLFPLQSYLKFSDHSNLQLLSDDIIVEPDESKRFGPFYPPAGKLVTEVNVKVGSSFRVRSTGLKYTIAVDGCL